MTWLGNVPSGYHSEFIYKPVYGSRPWIISLMFDNSKSFSGHLECNISDKTMKNITNIES